MSSTKQLEVSPEGRVLHQFEEDLVAALRDSDLSWLSQELHRSRAISTEMQSRFSLLDHETLDCGLQVRYLLQHVSERAGQVSQFLTVLRGLGKKAEKVCARVSLGTGSSKGGENIGHLTEADVPFLVEALVQCSYRWEELGIALHLPRHVLEECRSCTSNNSKLYHILIEWVTGQYQNVKPATMKSLKDALASPVVGEAKLSLELHEAGAKPVAICGTESTLTIVYQSSTTEVTEGKSVLLEVRVLYKEPVNYQWMKNSQPLLEDSMHVGTSSSILYVSSVSRGSQGSYTCLVECGDEKVKSEDIKLCVIFPPEKQHLLQKYSRLNEVPKDSWPPVSATSFINLALINKELVVERDAAFNYTLMGNKDDILTHKVRISYEDVFSEYSSGTLMLVEGRPGSGKTTLVHKVTRDWAVNGSTLKGAKMVVLVALRLLNYKGKDQTMEDLLELHYARQEDRARIASEIDMSSGKEVCFILDGLDEYPLKNKQNAVVSQLLDKQYSEAMVIVASRHIGTGRFRQRADKIVEVLGFEGEQIFKYIDAFPFKKCNDLCRSVVAGNVSTSLKTYLNNHKNILHMCYLPVHSAMLCYLYSQLRDDLPNTETEVYECFTKLVLLREMAAADHSAVRIESLQDLKGRNRDQFRAICYLAFDMCIKSKQVLHQSETDVPLFQQGGAEAPSLGLLKVDPVAKLFGIENTYCFHHLTFQEFLAAFYVAGLEEEQQMELIKEHCNWSHYLYFGGMLWKFYCGLVKFEDKLDQFATILSLSLTDSLYPLQCAFQSQQKLACDMVMERYDGQLHIQGHTLTLSDINALKYVTTTSSHSVLALTIKCFRNIFVSEHSQTLNDTLQCCKKLQVLILSSGDVDSHGAKILSSALKYCTNLQHFNISRNSIGSSGAVALADNLKSCSGIEELNFSKTDIGLNGMVALSESLLYLSNLQSLHLSHNDICLDGINALPHADVPIPYSHPVISLIEVLKSCSDFRSLNLSRFSKAGSDGMNALAAGLKHCRRLRVLELQNVGFGITDAAALASGLEYCNDLVEFDVSYNASTPIGMHFLSAVLIKMGNLKVIKLMKNGIGVCSSGIVPLAKVMRSCDLHNLDLCENNITPEGAEALAEGLKSCRNLQKLDISDNEISYGAAALPVGLKHCKKLTELDISNNNIKSAAVDLAGGLGYCTNLLKLYVSDNNIGPKGGAAIAAALTHCSDLQILDFSNNCIGSEGAVALADMLQSCRHMPSLNLTDNGIGDVGSKALSANLKYCSHIEELILSSNAIHLDGAAALADGLQYCNCLKILDLEDNCIGDDGAAALASGLNACLSLTQLDLGNNSISTAGAIALADRLPSMTCGLHLMGNDIGPEGHSALSKTKFVVIFSDKEKEDTDLISEEIIASVFSIGAMFGLLDERTMKKIQILPPP